MNGQISVIIPFLNESENIPQLCKVLDSYSEKSNRALELIFVDDGSSDDSVKKIKEFSFKYTSVKIVRLSKNYGSHLAIRAGIKVANADFCIFFSSDLQEPVEMISVMARKMEESSCDYVCARKINENAGIAERFFSSVYARLIRRLAVSNFPKGGVNNILFNKKVKDNLNENIEKNSSVFLQIMDMGYKMEVIDVKYLPRASGSSKWTFSKRLKLLIDSFVSFSFFPIRIVSLVGILLFVFGFLFAITTITIRVFNIYPMALGWPTLISMVSMGFGVTNISLGIIAEYLWRDIDYSRGKPAFYIDEIIKINTQEI